MRQPMDLFNKATILLALDVLIRTSGAIAVIYLLWNVYSSLRRGYVFIYGKVATRHDEPFGYWFGIVCWILASGILAMVIYRGL